MLETGLGRHWTSKGEEMRAQLGDFQVAFQELEELTSNSAMIIIKFRNEISQQLETVGTVLWKCASSISSPGDFLKCMSKGD